MALNMSGTNGNIPPDTSMDFDKVEHTSVLQIPLAYTILGHVFSLVFQIVADKQLLMVLFPRLPYMLFISVTPSDIICNIFVLFAISNLSSMIVLSNVKVVKLLVCGDNLSWLINFILIFEIVD